MGASRVQGASLRRKTLHSVLSYKRLERGRFRLPRIREGATRITLDATQLGMLLDGIDVEHVRRAKHWTPPTAMASAGHG
ncbi:MAG: IS66 family insertion sequence element accessory protein TnpB [Polyangiaceae bacterium]